MTVIGNNFGEVTLNAAEGAIDIIGEVHGYGPAGRAANYQLFAAVYGPGPTSFDIVNTGDIESFGDTGLDAGIVLFAPPIITNHGTIAGGSGIIDVGAASGAYFKNTGIIFGRLGDGILVSGTAGLSNAGIISGGQLGVVLGHGGVISNTGNIYGQSGIIAGGIAQVDNSGQIHGTGYTGIQMAGSLSNAASGTIFGFGTAVALPVGAVVYNRGEIIGGTGIATTLGGLFRNIGFIGGTTAGITATQSAGFLTDVYNTSTGSITGGSYGLALGGTAVAAGSGVDAYSSIGNAGYIGGGVGFDKPRGFGFRGAYGASYTALLMQDGRVTNTGTINGGATGIFVASGPGDIYNAGGLIQGGSTGIFLADGGQVLNLGQIVGGVVLDGAGGIYNYGNIVGRVADVVTNSTIVNVFNAAGGFIAGNVSAFAGIVLNEGIVDAAGGTGIAGGGGDTTIFNTGTVITDSLPFGVGVSLATPGIIVNTGLIEGSAYGVRIQSGGTLFDSGTIIATDSPDAIHFSPPSRTGAAANVLVLTPGCVLRGRVELYGTLVLAAGTTAGAVDSRTIEDITGLVVDRGASWRVSNKLYDGATLFNDGTISTGRTGIDMPKTGAAYNYGLLKGAGGISLSGGYVFNSGLISTTGTAAAGILLRRSGYIINTGLVDAAGTAAAGISLGTHDAFYNYGAVTAGSAGVTSTGRATVYNYAGGQIAGQTGIQLVSGNIYDAGIISGATTAIDFSTTGANRLTLTQNATLSGGVTLSGGALQLVHGAHAGAQAGTLTLSQFTGAAALTIAAGADWTIAASLLLTTIAITNDGTLKSSGPDTTIAGAVSGTGTIAITTTLTLDAAVAASQKIAFTGTAETLALASPQNFSAALKNFAPGDTIDLAGLTFSDVETTVFANGVLSINATTGPAHLTFANPAAFNGETFSLFADGAGTGITLSSSTPAMAFLTPARAATPTPTAAALPAYTAPARPAAAPIPQTSIATTPPAWLPHFATQPALPFVPATL